MNSKGTHNFWTKGFLIYLEKNNLTEKGGGLGKIFEKV